MTGKTEQLQCPFRRRPARSAVAFSGWMALLIVALSGNATTLQWKEIGGHRAAPVLPDPAGKTGFTLLSSQATGIQFTNTLSKRSMMLNANLLNGAGAASGDVDGDGLCDLFLCNLDGSNRLYKNLGGWQFRDVTKQAGVATPGMFSTGATFGDLDGDGDLDLAVASCGGPNALFLNDGNGRFNDVTTVAGFGQKRMGSTSIAMGDLDLDGDLDIYVANYGEISVFRTGGAVSIRTIGGKPVVTGLYANRVRIIEGGMVEVGEPDLLFLNNGQGQFSRVNWTGGRFLDENGESLKREFTDMGLSVMIRDINHDKLPDIYVCNDFQTPDRVWINQGEGRFRLINEAAMRHRSHFAMAVDFADINRDGRDDFFVADMMSPSHLLKMTQTGVTNLLAKPIDELIDRPLVHHNTLFVNRGDNTYMETANYSGVAATEWTWGAVFMDADLDGLEDLFIANGHAFDTQDLDTIEKTAKLGKLPAATARKKIFLYPPLTVPNMLLENQGNLRFRDRGVQWGFHSRQVSHGISLADFDNDGDPDVVVSCLNAPPLIYRNNSPAPRLALRLRGTGGNTRGIGARIRVTGGPRPQSQEMIAGGRYLAGDQPRRTFAAVGAKHLAVEVIWPGGKRSVLKNARPNHIYEINENSSIKPPKVKTGGGFRSRFRRVDTGLVHTHTEMSGPEFLRQPLLPRSIDQSGPGVIWFDWDGNGQEELFFGSGSGTELTGYTIDENSRFKLLDSPVLQLPLEGDAMGMSGWVAPDGSRALLVAVSACERPDADTPSLRILKKNSPKPDTIALKSSAKGADAGSLAVADVDGDSDLDLFIAGRGIPGQYPRPASSWFFRCGPSGLKLDSVQTDAFSNTGLVTGAVFTDLDNDGFPELALACEWGPVRVFKNETGRFREATEAWDLLDQTGLWQTITAGDFDGDGRMDLLAGNWGLNSHLGHGAKLVPHLFHGDLDDDGRYDVIEANLETTLNRMLPRHNLLTLENVFPWIREAFPTHHRYGSASLGQLFGLRLEKTKTLRTATLASTLLLNRGGRFEARPLPIPAQLTPVMGTTVADWNGDGTMDIFISQNYFATRVDDYRLDAGEGLLLNGDGQGEFWPEFGHRSGIRVLGEQRGCATGDLNADGRPDLIVCQNEGTAAAFENVAGTPGLRVHLQGPTGNPHGISAMMQAVYRNGATGPAVELHAGHGRYSQDSAIAILGNASQIKAVKVRWPGGRETRTTVSAAGDREMRIQF